MVVVIAVIVAKTSSGSGNGSGSVRYQDALLYCCNSHIRIKERESLPCPLCRSEREREREIERERVCQRKCVCERESVCMSEREIGSFNDNMLDILLIDVLVVRRCLC